MAPEPTVHHLSAERTVRRIRSFVRREGRMTEAQRRAFERLWPRYGFNPQGLLDLPALFGRHAPVHMEIGFGMGDTLLQMAASHPENDYLGIEVYRPGVGHLLRGLEREKLDNVRLVCADAIDVLALHLAPDSIAAVYLFFPDPWPKRRHHKRRLVQPEWAALVRSRLAADGIVHMATDWEDYAHHMLGVMEGTDGLRNVAGPGRFSPRIGDRAETKFERRGRRLGHCVWDLVYRRS